MIAVVRVPHIKVSEIDFYLDHCEFKLSAAPYFLRLTLPHPIVENGRERAQFDHESGSLTCFIPKLNHGQLFPDLDLLTTLLAPPRRDASAVPMVQVLSSSDRPPASNTPLDFDWQQESASTVEESADLPPLVPQAVGYGFNRAYSRVFAPYADELSDILDSPLPESLALVDVRAARLLSEEERFDPDHYLADFVDEDGTIGELVRFKPQCVLDYELRKASSDTADTAAVLVFTEDEQRAMLELPNREHLLLAGHDKVLALGLVDLLFAYAYDVRTTMGDATVESAWTICKLSAQLSWLDELHSLDDVWRSSMRRSLTFPLHRSWTLSCKVWKDVKVMLKLGRRMMLRALLAVRHLLERAEQRRLLARIYLDDYCIWLQHVDEELLRALTREVLAVEPQRAALFECIDLDELEAYARQHEQLEGLD